MILLSVHDLAKSHGGKPVFAGVTFSLAAGDRLAVLGASGSGKTTLLRLLAGRAGRRGEGSCTHGA